MEGIIFSYLLLCLIVVSVIVLNVMAPSYGECNEGVSAASLCHQVAALVQDMFCNFYLSKNHKIANILTVIMPCTKFKWLYLLFYMLCYYDLFHYSECHSTKCQFAKCRLAYCHNLTYNSQGCYAHCRFDKCHSIDCHYLTSISEGRYTDCRRAKCRKA